MHGSEARRASGVGIERGLSAVSCPGGTRRAGGKPEGATTKRAYQQERLVCGENDAPGNLPMGCAVLPDIVTQRAPRRPFTSMGVQERTYTPFAEVEGHQVTALLDGDHQRMPRQH